MSDIIVNKYGGSSITSSKDIEIIRDIIKDDSRRKIMVVSAPYGVTNMLIELAKTKSNSLFNEIIKKYDEIFPNHKEIPNLLEQKLDMNLPEKEYSASIKAFGEDACAQLMTDFLNLFFKAEYIDPKELFLLTQDFENAKILPKSEEMIKKRLSNLKTTAIIPGFFGYTKNGKIATFSRGGTDLTGSYIAASLNAILYENFKDVDGIYATNPKLVPDAHKIDEITYKEIRDLAYSGFKVFHKKAMEPVAKKGIPVHVRSMFTYPSEGTYIVHDRITDPKKPIIGVAYKDGFCSFNIESFGLNDEVGVIRKILQVFEDQKISEEPEKKGLSIEFIPGAIDDISIILRKNQLKGVNIVGDITNNLYLEVGKEAKIDFQENLASLVVAGKGLKGNRGIAADIQATLANANTNIRFITQGPKERCIVYGIDSSDGKKAVNAIYDKYLR